MERLIELSKKIKDEKLRKMVVDFLKDLKLSNKSFSKYPKMKVEEAATMFTVNGSTVERDVLNHTISLVDLCEKSADSFKKTLGLSIDKDKLISAAILHDVMKLFEWERGPSGLEHTGILLDHTMLGVAELYHRGFPEDIIHIVASHFGDGGPTPPRTFEALILHHLDTMTSLVEFRLCKRLTPMHLIMMEDDELELGEKSGEREKTK